MSIPVRYIDRSKEYYLSEGYDKPYRWAQHDDAPFSRLKKPLSECCLTIVSTSDVAVKPDPGAPTESENTLVGNVYGLSSTLKSSDLMSHQEHYDAHTTNIDDVDSFFPITRLQEAATEGRIGSVAPELYGVYTAYSQRKTREVDAPDVLKRCLANNVDAAILTPV